MAYEPPRKKPVDPVRLWKDEKYRDELTDDERAQFEKESAQIMAMTGGILGNPAGAVEVGDDELLEAVAARRICSENASISTTWCNNPKHC
jgi:hypothetical protein